MINLLKHSATIQSVSNAQTTSGTYNPTYSTRITALRCLIQGKTVKSTDSFGKISLQNVYKLYCENNTTNLTIVETDRVVFGSQTFEITGIKDAAGQSHHLEMNLLEVK